MSTQNKSNKRTAWKKNREFGDIMGGRCRRKLDGNVFIRLHSFHRPTEFDELPIIVADNPSRDYYFPVSPDEIKATLANLPDSGIVTHVWLRKHNKKNNLIIDSIKGSGIRTCDRNGRWLVFCIHRKFCQRFLPGKTDSFRSRGFN